MKPYKIIVDAKRLKTYGTNTIEGKQGDKDTRIVNAIITADGVPLDLTGKTVTFYAIKPDKTKIFNSTTIKKASDGEIEFNLTTQVLAVEGLVKGELAVFGADGSKLTSALFIIEVIKSINDESAIESQNEFTLLTDALTKLTTWDNQFETKYNGLEAEYAEDITLVKSQLAETATDLEGRGINIKSLGAIGDGESHPLSDFFPTLELAQMKYPHATSLEQEVDWASIQGAIYKTGFAVIPDGRFVVNDEILVPSGTKVVGAGFISSEIISKVKDNKHIFNAGEGTMVEDQTVYFSGFQIRGYESPSEGGYGIYIKGMLNSVIENCHFRGLGGGAIKNTRSSNVTVDKCYVFSCGLNPYYGKPENGAIHTSREGGWGNTFNVMNTYVSNCSNMSGLHMSGHANRVINVTVESCHTLLKVGSPSYVSRNLTVIGLYMENAKTYGIDIENLLTGVFINNYLTDSGLNTIANLRINIASNVRFENCLLGSKIEVDDLSLRNIRFEDCTGDIPEGFSGFNENDIMKNTYASVGGFAEGNNLIQYSNDFSKWIGAADVTDGDGLNNTLSSTILSKTTSNSEKYVNFTDTFLEGTKIVASIYLKGKLQIRIRGVRASDGVGVDLKSNKKDTQGEWKRISVAAELLEDYSSITYRITPGSSSESSATCEVAAAQFETGKLSAGVFILTNGRPITENLVGSINGDYAIGGTIRSRKSEKPTTGRHKQGDYVENTNPTIQGDVGSRYVVKGWIRITSGFSNALNVDWVEDRVLTGS